jgi:chaperonin GroEL (HSP60 family)
VALSSFSPSETRTDSYLIVSSDPESFRKDLFNIAKTTLSSKVLSQDKNYFANLAVDAVLRLKVRLTTMNPRTSSHDI